MSGICRLCLSVTSKGAPLYGSDDRLLMSVRTCLPLAVSWSKQEPFPEEVCAECCHKVDLVNEFCRTATLAQRRLTEHLDAGVERLHEFYEFLRVQAKQENSEENKENLLETRDQINVKVEADDVHEEKYVYSSEDDVNLSALRAVKHIDGTDTAQRKHKKHKYTKRKEKKVKKEKIPKKNNDLTFFPEGTAEVDKKWQCLACLSYLESRMSLLNHYKSEHGPPSTDTAQTESDVIPKFGRKKKQGGYTEVHDGEEGSPAMFECLTCGKKFKRSTIDRHLLSHSKSRPFQCKLCGRAYKSASDIVLHGRAHTGFKTLSCGRPACDYRTVYPGALAAHRRRHDAHYKYKCETCGKGFNVRTWYAEHANVHSGARPFACAHCPKTFPFSRYLTSHVSAVHGGGGGAARGATCPSCGATLPSRRRLRAHLAAAHGVGAQLLCERCGKALSSPEHLETHRRAHLGVKPHACGTCDKAFVKKCNLTLHERVHSGEKPYACTHCAKAFSQRSTLVIHLRYHTGARPYQCEYCPKAFVARGLLSAHQKVCF